MFEGDCVADGVVDAVAEGVEEEAMFQLLREAGVEHFQGHLFSRPLSRERLAAIPGPFPPRSSPSSE